MAVPNLGPDAVEILYSSDLVLSDKAVQLVGFDCESVSRLIRARRDPEPDMWLARPEGYQSDGHVLRDSEAIRLIAYCQAPQVVYATDGCNACRHRVDEPPGTMSDDELMEFASETQLPLLMLKRLAAQLKKESSK